MAAARRKEMEALWSEANGARVIGKKNPIKRILDLLEKMRVELQAEADDEEDMYKQTVLWCKTNKKEKTKAIDEADAKETDLMADIEERSARFGQVSTDIDYIKQQLAEDKAALDKATKIRGKESDRFRAEEKDMIQAMTNLKNAITVLKKVQGGSLLQVEPSLLTGMRVVLRDAALKYQTIVGDAPEPRESSPKQTVLLAVDSRYTDQAVGQRNDLSDALLRALNVSGEGVAERLPSQIASQVVNKSAHEVTPASKIAGNFLQSSAGQPSYSARSNSIFGILSRMLDEFDNNLANLRSEEAKADADYEALAKAKDDQIEMAKRKVDDFQTGDANNQKSLADAKEELSLTRKQRGEDIKFLRNVELSCKDLDGQFAARKKTRGSEMIAISDAITILSEDSTRELMSKTVTFLQLASSSSRTKQPAQPADDFGDLLGEWHMQTANQQHRDSAASHPRRIDLSTLTLIARSQGLGKVKEMIEKKVEELKDEQQQEVKFRTYCNQEFKKIEKDIFTSKTEKEDLEDKINELQADVKKLGQDIADAGNKITETKAQLKKAEENRQKETADYKNTLEDQRLTQDILKKALQKLADYYKKGLGKEVFLQRSHTAQTPPAKFTKYQDNAKSGPVLSMLEDIIKDSVSLVEKAKVDEKKAAADYKTFVQDSKLLLKSLETSIVEKTKNSASTKRDLNEAKSEHQSKTRELVTLTEYDADMHKECDFVLENFATRQKARSAEVDDLQAARSAIR